MMNYQFNLKDFKVIKKHSILNTRVELFSFIVNIGSIKEILFPIGTYKLIGNYLRESTIDCTTFLMYVFNANQVTDYLKAPVTDFSNLTLTSILFSAEVSCVTTKYVSFYHISGINYNFVGKTIRILKLVTASNKVKLDGKLILYLSCNNRVNVYNKTITIDVNRFEASEYYEELRTLHNINHLSEKKGIIIKDNAISYKLPFNEDTDEIVDDKPLYEESEFVPNPDFSKPTKSKRRSKTIFHTFTNYFLDLSKLY